MTSMKQIFLIDSSALFSGIPLNFDEMITTPEIADEFQPGGRDYRRFQLLVERGLRIIDPTNVSIKKIEETIGNLGEKKRLSPADISLLALALDIKSSEDMTPVILTDDYSIQNIAHHMDLTIQSLNQKGITKRFKWERRCQGCRRKVPDDVDVCPDCGSSITHVVKKKFPLRKQR
jgi:UPF0271 protein